MNMKVLSRFGKIFFFLVGLTILVFLSACKHHFTPKPKGYFRISFPKHKYKTLEDIYPYTFDVPDYVTVAVDKQLNAEPYWINLDYPLYNGKIHISYKKIEDNLNMVIEDSRKLAYKHSIKADAIGEKLFIKPDKKVYGILYDIKGNAASSVQFFLTDSIKNFLRGALYFNSVPNKDSLAPVISFVKEDVIHLMETFEWKEIPKH